MFILGERCAVWAPRGWFSGCSVELRAWRLWGSEIWHGCVRRRDAPEKEARCPLRRFGICGALEGAGAAGGGWGGTLHRAESPSPSPKFSSPKPPTPAAGGRIQQRQPGGPAQLCSLCRRLSWNPEATSSPSLRTLLASRSISAKRWLCHPKSRSSRPRRGGEMRGGGYSACPRFGGCGAGSGLRHTGEGSNGAEEMLFVSSRPSEEARGGRSEASSRIRVVMVNLHPGIGKRRHFPKTSWAPCGCRASPGSGVGQASVGVCWHAAGVPGNSMCPAGK